MQKPYFKVSLGNEANARWERIAARYEMSPPTLAALIITELSHVRPESLFEALGAIPADLKARSPGRPPGSVNRERESAAAIS